MLHETVVIGTWEFDIFGGCAAQDAETFRTLVNRFVTEDKAWRTSYGYIAHPTSEKASSSLITADRMVCAWHGRTLAGFYLADHWRHIYNEERFSYLQNVFFTVCKTTGINPTKVGCGAQTVVDLPYQGTGLRVAMLKTLLERLSEVYTHLFSMIGKDNGRAIKAHGRDGWMTVAEDEGFTYVMLDVHMELVRLTASERNSN